MNKVADSDEDLEVPAHWKVADLS